MSVEEIGLVIGVALLCGWCRWWLAKRRSAVQEIRADLARSDAKWLALNEQLKKWAEKNGK